VQPLVGELRTSLEMKLNRPVRMSGSGSTMYGIFEKGKKAEISSSKLQLETFYVA